MAGAYPDPPGNRMAWHDDGSGGFVLNATTNSLVGMTPAEMLALNNESDDTVLTFGVGTIRKIGVVFPEPRDLDGYYLGRTFTGSANPGIAEVSYNTTNGADGTWETVANPYVADSGVSPSYRDAVQPLSVSAAKGIRFSGSTSGGGSVWNWQSLHLYGSPVSIADVDRIAFWQPAANAEVVGAHFDWGSSPRESSADKTFRLKNESAVKTAYGVSLTVEAITEAATPIAEMHLLSADGAAFAATLEVGDLPPGAITDVLWLRRIISPTATTGAWTQRLVAVADSWV